MTPTPPQAGERAEALDAARYRWMVKWIMTGETLPADQAEAIDAAMDNGNIADFDAAIDGAMTALGSEESK